MKNGIRLLIALLMLFAPACARTGPADDPEIEPTAVVVEVTPTTAATDVPADTPEVLDEPEQPAPDAIALDPYALDELDSYHVKVVFQMEIEDDDEGEEDEVTVDMVATRDPEAYQIFTDLHVPTDHIIIGNDVWVTVNGEWNESDAGPDKTLQFFKDFFFLDQMDWFDNLEDADYDYLGEETVNGFNSRHYHITYTSAPHLIWAEEIHAANADIWIADEPELPDLIVRFILRIEDAVLSGGEAGAITLTQNIHEVNNPDIVIEPPEDVVRFELPEGVPEYPNITDRNAMGNTLSMMTEDDVATIHAFYEAHLEEAGWDRIVSLPSDDTLSETWELDGQELQLLIGPFGSSFVIMITLVE
jgi:hypothetical protein